MVKEADFDEEHKVRFVGRRVGPYWQHECVNPHTKEPVLRHISNVSFCGVCGWEHSEK